MGWVEILDLRDGCCPLLYLFPRLYGVVLVDHSFPALVVILGVLEACCGLLLPSCWAMGSGLIPCFKCARFTDRVLVDFVGYAMMRYAILACFPSPLFPFLVTLCLLGPSFQLKEALGFGLVTLGFWFVG